MSKPSAASNEATADQLMQKVLIGDAVYHSGLVVLIADDEMRFLAATDSACHLLGYSRAELLEKQVSDVVVDQEAAATRFEAMIHARRQEGTTTLRRKDGSTVTADYEARQTQVSGLEYYMSILRPLEE
jgi:PAS domain S-box-containing protein